MDTSTIETRLQALDHATLTVIVRRALDRQSAEVTTWEHQPISIGRGSATGGVYRVAGTAQDQGVELSWSVILKVLSSAASGNVPAEAQDITHPLYWQREALAYQSGLLDELPQGLSAPRCLAVEEHDDTIWLWLEEAKEITGSRWSLVHFEHAARLLGKFNGRYLAGEPLPSYAWLGRDGSPRGVLHHFASMQDAISDPAMWAHPLLKAAYPVPVADRLLRLWADRGVLLDAFERLPYTLCHLDAWRKNMFAGMDGTLTLIDWAYVGRGVIGTDAGDLIGASYGLFGAEPCDPAELDAAIFNGYLDGLREASWRGDPRVVRFAYTTFTALKYAGLLLEIRDVLDDARHAAWEDIAGQPMTVFLPHKAALTYYLLDLLDEARELMQTL